MYVPILVVDVAGVVERDLMFIVDFLTTALA